MVFPAPLMFTSFFFFNDTATTEIYTLSLHDALPISGVRAALRILFRISGFSFRLGRVRRSEEHTSELQSQSNLVCRLLLEKKKYNQEHHRPRTMSDSLSFCGSILRQA